MQRDATTLDITELPIRKWTQDYKEMLEGLVKPEDRTAPALIEVRRIAKDSQAPPKIQLLNFTKSWYGVCHEASAMQASSTKVRGLPDFVAGMLVVVP